MSNSHKADTVAMQSKLINISYLWLKLQRNPKTYPIMILLSIGSTLIMLSAGFAYALEILPNTQSIIVVLLSLIVLTFASCLAVECE